MLFRSLRPDANTYAALMESRLRVGEWEEALRWHRALRTKGDIVPTFRSAVAMFDALAAGGLSERAKEEWGTHIPAEFPSVAALPKRVTAAVQRAMHAEAHRQRAAAAAGPTTISAPVATIQPDPSDLFF